MNPALNNVTRQTPGNVQVLNVLDVPQVSTTLEQFAMADVGLLEGIPGGMFDWGVYDFMHGRERTPKNIFALQDSGSRSFLGSIRQT